MSCSPTSAYQMVSSALLLCCVTTGESLLSEEKCAHHFFFSPVCVQDNKFRIGISMNMTKIQGKAK